MDNKLYNDKKNSVTVSDLGPLQCKDLRLIRIYSTKNPMDLMLMVDNWTAHIGEDIHKTVEARLNETHIPYVESCWVR